MRDLFLTFFYVGKIPKAPGTFGSIAAFPVALAILLVLPASTLFMLGLFLLIIGAKIVNAYEDDTGIHDDKRIVIDEVAGVFVAVAIAPGAMIPLEHYYHFMQPQSLDLFIPALMSLAYFRLFDIWKPSIIGRVDKQVQGGWGVMGDDILAGFVAGVCSAISWVAIGKISFVS